MLTLALCLISSNLDAQVTVINNTHCEMIVGGQLGPCSEASGSTSGRVPENATVTLPITGSGNLVLAEATLSDEGCEIVQSSYYSNCGGGLQQGQARLCCPTWQVLITAPNVITINP